MNKNSLFRLTKAMVVATYIATASAQAIVVDIADKEQLTHQKNDLNFAQKLPLKKLSFIYSRFGVDLSHKTQGLISKFSKIDFIVDENATIRRCKRCKPEPLSFHSIPHSLYEYKVINAKEAVYLNSHPLVPSKNYLIVRSKWLNYNLEVAPYINRVMRIVDLLNISIAYQLGVDRKSAYKSDFALSKAEFLKYTMSICSDCTETDKANMDLLTVFFLLQSPKGSKTRKETQRQYILKKRKLLQLSPSALLYELVEKEYRYSLTH